MGGKEMTTVQYCTPEWLEVCAKNFQESAKLQKAFEKMALKVCFLIRSEPEWGIETDILFAAYINHGVLERISFISIRDAENEADYILGATPQQWKKLLTKESKFVGDILLGKVTVDKGSKPGVLGLAPYAANFVEALTPVEIQYPDQMTQEELERYRAYITEFRDELKV
jgi:hypothetical protein